MWSTEHLYQLAGNDPVLEWLKASAVPTVLPPDDRERFPDVYRQRLRESYPALGDETILFPFQRLVMVAAPQPRYPSAFCTTSRPAHTAPTPSST